MPKNPVFLTYVRVFFLKKKICERASPFQNFLPDLVNRSYRKLKILVNDNQNQDFCSQRIRICMYIKQIKLFFVPCFHSRELFFLISKKKKSLFQTFCH